MTPEEVTLVRYRLERAKETLAEAALLRENAHLNAAVNRLYYACFYAVTGLLLTEGQSSSKHSGVRALFDANWVKNGRVSKDAGRFYRQLFDMRQKGDYADLTTFAPDDVREWQGSATRFVETIKAAAESQIGSDV
jgi:hypothetical protein